MAQNEGFQVFWKISAWNFPDLLHKITAALGVKNWLRIFFEKTFTGVFGQNIFWLFWQIDALNVTDFSHLNYCSIKAQNWVIQILFWVFLGKMRLLGKTPPKMDSEVFKVFMGNGIFWTKLHQHKGLKLKSNFKQLLLLFLLLFVCIYLCFFFLCCFGWNHLN